jgi:hypothetical protein
MVPFRQRNDRRRHLKVALRAPHEVADGRLRDAALMQDRPTLYLCGNFVVAGALVRLYEQRGVLAARSPERATER